MKNEKKALKDIEKTLTEIIRAAPNLNNASGAGRVFELYVMTGIGLALKRLNYDVWVQRSDGSRVKPTSSDLRFIQRGGKPTGIKPSAQGKNNASSIVFCLPNRPAWELLNGVQFKGRSTSHHEIDLAVIPEAVASYLRSNQNGGSPLGRPRVSIECKDVKDNGGVDEMREFVARMYDLSILQIHHRHLGIAPPFKAIYPGAPSGSIHRPVKSYWNENQRTLNVLARRTGFPRGTSGLARYYLVERHSNITVGSSYAQNLMDDVANWISKRCN